MVGSSSSSFSAKQFLKRLYLYDYKLRCNGKGRIVPLKLQIVLIMAEVGRKLGKIVALSKETGDKLGGLAEYFFH